MRIFLFGVLLFLVGCNTQRNATDTKCKSEGIVTDFSYLDGCGLMIVLKTGEKLNPVKIQAGFELKAGQHVLVSFRKLKDMMSICMAEDAHVEITCIEEVSQTNGTTDCTDTDNPFSISWMDQAIDKHNPTRVLKYRSTGSMYYLFSAYPESFLYDCFGRLICTTSSTEDDCYTLYIESLGRGKIIWQGEGVWD